MHGKTCWAGKPVCSEKAAGAGGGGGHVGQGPRIAVQLASVNTGIVCPQAASQSASLNRLSERVITGQGRGPRTDRGSALPPAGCHQPYGGVRT